MHPSHVAFACNEAWGAFAILLLGDERQSLVRTRRTWMGSLLCHLENGNIVISVEIYRDFSPKFGMTI